MIFFQVSLKAIIAASFLVHYATAKKDAWEHFLCYVFHICPATPQTSQCSDTIYDFIIVGGGFSGIAAGLRLKEFNEATGSSYTYKIMEADSVLGGRAVAAVEISGPENPILEFLESELGGTMPDQFVTRDYDSVTYFDSNGTLHDEMFLNDTLNEFYDAFECVQKERGGAFANGTIPDESWREALTICGWDKPDVSSLQGTLEQIFIEEILVGREELTGLYNVPFEATPQDVGGPELFYLKYPRNSAGVAAAMAGPIMDNIMLDTTVDKIDWRGSEVLNGIRPVQVYATSNQDGNQTCYLARRAIVTTSIGVFDHRGDCKYTSTDELNDNCDPNTTDLVMYNPILPESKMNAVRELYIDDTRRPTGMGEYRSFRFQFDKKFWSNITTQYISTDNPVNNTRFVEYSNLDLPDYYPGTNALFTILVTDGFDELGGEDKSVPAAVVNEMLAETIGNAFKSDFFNESTGEPLYVCTKIPPGQWPDPNPGLGENECVYSTFEGENELWYGAYSYWRETPGFSSRADAMFSEVWEPLKPTEDSVNGEYVLWFSGSAYCDYHSEFVHGGYWSGRLIMNEVLDDLGETLNPTLVQTDEYRKCFGLTAATLSPRYPYGYTPPVRTPLRRSPPA